MTQTFGATALMHRCHVHKFRNLLEHLPDGQRSWVRAMVRRAYHRADVANARRLLHNLARRLGGPLPERRGQRA